MNSDGPNLDYGDLLRINGSLREGLLNINKLRSRGDWIDLQSQTTRLALTRKKIILECWKISTPAKRKKTRDELYKELGLDE